MRITLILVVLLAAAFIGCVEKGADGETTTTTTTTDAVTASPTATATATPTTTATNTTTAPPAPACAVWLHELSARTMWSPPAPSPGVVFSVEVDAEDATKNRVMVYAIRTTIGSDGEPREGSEEDVTIRTNARGEGSYTWEPPAGTGKYRLTIINMEQVSGTDDCTYAKEQNVPERDYVEGNAVS